MTKATNLRKSWIGGASRVTTTFNAPGSLTLPYGQFKGTVSGRAGTGNDPVAATYSITYATNYNIAYPIANQPIANQPATAFTTNYNTNYNTVYPIANQPETGRPITSYTPGNPGASTTVLGVFFPGGAVSTLAPTVSPTLVDYERFPDNANYPVAVPPGGQIVIKIE